MKTSVRLGYKDYIMDAEKALVIMEILSKAEIYESKWNSLTKETTHYIYEQDNADFIREMKVLPEALYRIAKLAGKPNKE